MIQPHHITQAVRRTQDALLLATEKPASRPQNGGGGGSSIEPPTPLPVGLISAKRELADWLADWCSMVRDGLGVVANYDLDEHSRLEWLGTGERAEFLANHETAQDFLDEITVLTKQLESPYIPRTPKVWLGKHGGGDVKVITKQETVELEDGRVEHVESIRAWNRDQVRLAQGTAAEVAEMIWEFFNIYIKPNEITEARTNDDRIKNRHPGLLSSTRKDGREHIYTVQNVLDRFPEKETITRVDKQGPIV